MNTMILQPDLRAALTMALPTVAGKSSLPILACVRMGTENGRVRIDATDLSRSVSILVNAKIETEGAICIPAKPFTELIGSFPDAPVQIRLRGATSIVEIICGSIATSIHGMDADEFPVLPTLNGQTSEFRVPGAALHAMAVRVGHAALDDAKDRPVLGGVHVLVSGRTLTVEAADSYRAAQMSITLDTDYPQPIETLIPVENLRYAASVLDDDDLPILMRSSYGHAGWNDDQVSVLSRVIDGKYPDLARVIPSGYTTRVQVAAAELRRAVRIATTIARESSKSIVLRFTPEDVGTSPQMEVFANASEFGSACTRIACSVVGMALEWTGNVAYLKDALDHIPTDLVALELSGPTMPMVIRPASDEAYLSLVMPMTVRA